MPDGCSFSQYDIFHKVYIIGGEARGKDFIVKERMQETQFKCHTKVDANYDRQSTIKPIPVFLHVVS